MKYKIKHAFTLAEVLVTLAIIGIVVALTIPTLIHSAADSGNYTKWKKDVSVISQAVKAIENEKGSIDFTSDTTFRNDFETKIPFVKKDTVGNLTNGINYKLFKSANTRDFSAITYPAAITSDGSTMAFDSLSPTCNANQGSLTNICGRIGIDVNSRKPPNTVGLDAFALFIVKINGNYQVYPLGSHSDGYACQAGNGLLANSSGCSMRVLLGSPMP